MAISGGASPYRLHLLWTIHKLSKTTMTRPLLRFDPSRHRRQATSFLATSSSSPVTPPKPGSTWERGAKLVKDTDVINPYLDRVRSEVVDPALQIKTIEDELCAAIGKALGKQGEKVKFAIHEMNDARARYLECIHAQAYEGALESAHHHNDARKRAIKARWELLVHRQAVGFTVDNHSVVHKTFPIGEDAILGPQHLPVAEHRASPFPPHRHVPPSGDATNLDRDMQGIRH